MGTIAIHFPLMRVAMNSEYDLSKIKARKNPYASKLKKAAAKTDSWNGLLRRSRDLAVDGLPPDLSVNLDHYLHGAPKRESSS